MRVRSKKVECQSWHEQKTLESLVLYKDQTSRILKKSILNIHWKRLMLKPNTAPDTENLETWCWEGGQEKRDDRRMWHLHDACLSKLLVVIAEAPSVCSTMGVTNWRLHTRHLCTDKLSWHSLWNRQMCITTLLHSLLWPSTVCFSYT